MPVEVGREVDAKQRERRSGHFWLAGKQKAEEELRGFTLVLQSSKYGSRSEMRVPV